MRESIKRICHIVYLFFIFSLLTACDETIIIEGNPQLVVEGWIENDRHPIVIITSTIPVNSEYQDINDLNSYAIKSAKVIVSDGEHEVVLTGVENKSYIPSFIYTTSDLKGEIGKSYKLTVDYLDDHLEATTKIMAEPCVDSLGISQINDTLFQVKTFLRDIDALPNYFKAFTMVRSQETFYLSYIGSTFTDKDLILKNGINIYPGDKFFDRDNKSYFNIKDTLMLKVTQIDEKGYKYWQEFEKMLATARNPIFPIRFNVNGNVIGGKGIWCGYGVVEKQIVFSNYLH